MKSGKSRDMENLIKQGIFQTICNPSKEKNKQKNVSKNTGYYPMKIRIFAKKMNLIISNAALKQIQKIDVGSILWGRGTDVNGSYLAIL